MEQKEKTFFASTYSIHPGVLDDGTPVWHLWRAIEAPFAPVLSIVATNADLDVLERAMKHMTKNVATSPVSE